MDGLNRLSSHGRASTSGRLPGAPLFQDQDRPVDFIVPMRGRPRMLVQVCQTLAEPQTRKRETVALSEAMAALGLKTGSIVTR